MRTEADFTRFIQKRLEAVKIEFNLEGSENVEIMSALQTASKNYALNGAIFYARKILEGTRYTKIFAFGNVGDSKHHIFKPVYIDATTIKELPAVETFIDFTPENVKNYHLSLHSMKNLTPAFSITPLKMTAGNSKNTKATFQPSAPATASNILLTAGIIILPTESDIADYLTFEFNMIVHGRGYLFDSAKKNSPPLIDVPPLENKIWKEFVVGNLFNVKIGKAVIGSAVDKTSGNYAYVTRKESNNGIDGFIDYDENFLNEDFPVITVGAETAAPFIQEFPFFTGIKVNILSPKNKLSKYGLLFIVQSMKMQQRNYNYAFALISSRVKQQKILLPVNDAGEPDFAYMEAFTKNLFTQLLKKYLER